MTIELHPSTSTSAVAQSSLHWLGYINGVYYSARVSMNHLVSCVFFPGITLENDTPCF